MQRAWEVRTVAQLRSELQQPIPVNADSLYKPVERTPRQFNKHVVPPKLVAKLPFASMPKKQAAPKSSKKAGYLKQRADPKTRLAHPKDTETRQAGKLVHQLNALKADKKRTAQTTKDAKKQVRARELGKIAASKAASSKAKNKREFEKHGKDQA